ncbi:TauD/TfdA family dioxygenase [Streptomyces sp. NPDC054854]
MKQIDYDFTFNDDEREDLRAALTDIASSPYSDFDTYLSDVKALRHDRRLGGRFTDFCEMSMLRDFSKQPLVVIGNAPIDQDLPKFSSADPVTEKYNLKKTFIGEGFLAAYAVLTGTEIIGHLSVNGGDFFHDIYPKESMFDSQSQKTLGTLKFHRDFTNHFVCPDFVNTLTLRDTPTNEVYSTFTVTVHALEELSDNDRDILAQARFYTPFDDVSTQEGNVLQDRRAKNHPVINGEEGARVFEDRTKGLDEEAQQVLDRFVQALHTRKQMRVSKPGDSVTFSNRHVIHGREVNAINDLEGLKQRWLLKTHNVYSLQAFDEFFLGDRYGVVNG